MKNILKAIALALVVSGCGSKATVSLTARTASAGVGQALTVNGGVNLTRVRMVVQKIELGSDPALGQMTGHSIRIEGTRNGTAFTFDSSLDEEQEREGNFTLHGGTNNIAFNIDPAGWFMNGATPLDPSDPTARSKIESNIKASIDTFKDDDNHGHR
jgi:hypothetical protein